MFSFYSLINRNLKLVLLLCRYIYITNFGDIYSSVLLEPYRSSSKKGGPLIGKRKILISTIQLYLRSYMGKGNKIQIERYV